MSDETRDLVVLCPDDFDEVASVAQPHPSRLKHREDRHRPPVHFEERRSPNWYAIVPTVLLVLGGIWFAIYSNQMSYKEGKLEAENTYLKREVEKLERAPSAGFNLDLSAIDFGGVSADSALVFSLVGGGVVMVAIGIACLGPAAIFLSIGALVVVGALFGMSYL